MLHDYIYALRHFYDFKGYTDKDEFLNFSVMQILVLFPYVICIEYVPGGNSQDVKELATTLLLIYYAITLVPALALAVRRMNDIEKPWYCAFIPLYNLTLFSLTGISPQKHTTAAAVPQCRYDLGDGYYLLYNQVSNMFGGYHDVNLRLYKKKTLIREITDSTGAFLDFPGVEHGDWEEDLTGSFRTVVSFVSHYYPFDENGLARFTWMVQPDGRYWADEYGFGMEKDVEICLRSEFDKTGQFVSPFKPI